MSRIAFNRMMHAMIGNGGPKFGKGRTSKGKGKGTGISSTAQTQQNPFHDVSLQKDALSEMYAMVKSKDDLEADQQYRARIRDALPSAAWNFTTPTLLPEEWDARVCLPHELSAAGGVTYVRKDQLPAVLKQVSFTTAPTAVVTTQTARDLGLPYSSFAIQCRLQIRNEEGQPEVVEVQKHLTQLGFGAPVEMAVSGPCVMAPRTMHKMVIRYDVESGIAPEDLTTRIVATTLSAIIDEVYFVDVVARSDGTATAMVQDLAVDKVLCASGVGHVYFKLHSTEPKAEMQEIYWLAEGCTHEAALQQSKADKILGLAFKRSTLGPRFGLRFASASDLEHFVKANKLGDRHTFGRFKMSNTPVSFGLRGISDMLEPHGWRIEEVEYFGEGSVTFLASQRGKVDELHWQDHRGRKVPVRIQAINTRAKQMANAASVATRASSSVLVSSDRRSRAQQQLFTRPPKDKEPRPTTGTTPQKKVQKQGALEDENS